MDIFFWLKQTNLRNGEIEMKITTKLCLILALLFSFSVFVPVFAINPEPYLMTALFDPELGKMLYLS